MADFDFHIVGPSNQRAASGTTSSPAVQLAVCQWAQAGANRIVLTAEIASEYELDAKIVELKRRLDALGVQAKRALAVARSR